MQSRPSFSDKLRPVGAVAGGGLIGSALRASVGVLIPSSPGSLPASTLIVNLVGSFLLGAYLARRQRTVAEVWTLRFWAIGALGSLTTFSGFSYETFALVDAGFGATAVGYMAVSIFGGLIAALVGDRLGRSIR